MCARLHTTTAPVAAFGADMWHRGSMHREPRAHMDCERAAVARHDCPGAFSDPRAHHIARERIRSVGSASRQPTRHHRCVKAVARCPSIQSNKHMKERPHSPLTPRATTLSASTFAKLTISPASSGHHRAILAAAACATQLVCNSAAKHLSSRALVSLCAPRRPWGAEGICPQGSAHWIHWRVMVANSWKTYPLGDGRRDSATTQ